LQLLLLLLEFGPFKLKLLREQNLLVRRAEVGIVQRLIYRFGVGRFGTATECKVSSVSVQTRTATRVIRAAAAKVGVACAVAAGMVEVEEVVEVRGADAATGAAAASSAKRADLAGLADRMLCSQTDGAVGETTASWF
jgi:hypothetical protein